MAPDPRTPPMQQNGVRLEALQAPRGQYTLRSPGQIDVVASTTPMSQVAPLAEDESAATTLHGHLVYNVGSQHTSANVGAGRSVGGGRLIQAGGVGDSQVTGAAGGTAQKTSPAPALIRRQ